MEWGWDYIIKVGILLTVVMAVILFLLNYFIFSKVEGAKERLEQETEAARAREAELNKKIKEADLELQKRKAELDTIVAKMKGEIEAQAQKEKDALINRAREEAEEIIVKAQNARDGIRKEIEKTMEFKIIDYSTKILSNILTEKAKSSFDRDLLAEFVEKLNNVDMSRITPDVQVADVITARPIDPQALSGIESVLSSKLNRKVQLKSKTDPQVAGGVILQFGSLQLDGSLQNSLRISAIACKQEVERK